MFNKIKEFFFGAPKQETQPEAPYKVEAPVPAKCGCGRSQSGNCVGLHALSPEEWATHKDNPTAQPTKPARKKAAAKPKAPAAKKAPAKKKAAK